MATPTFKDHIRELRNRLFITAGVFIVASTAAYYFRDPLIHVLLSPIHGESLMYLTPGGGFNFIFLVSIYAGLAVSIPLIIYQIYSFVRPTLPERSQKLGTWIFFLSILLMILGILFAYFYAIPGALNFLYSFAEAYVQASLTAESYLNFMVGYVLGLGAVFQLPLLLFITHKIKPLTPMGLLKSERWVIVLAFIAAALITPTPDPLNQAIVAAPIIFMYQCGVVAILYSLHKEKKAKKRALRAEMNKVSIPQPAPVKAPAPAFAPAHVPEPAIQAIHPVYKPAAHVQSAVVHKPKLISDMRPVRPSHIQSLAQSRAPQRPVVNAVRPTAPVIHRQTTAEQSVRAAQVRPQSARYGSIDGFAIRAASL